MRRHGWTLMTLMSSKPIAMVKTMEQSWKEVSARFHPEMVKSLELGTYCPDLQKGVQLREHQIKVRDEEPECPHPRERQDMERTSIIRRKESRLYLVPFLSDENDSVGVEY